jgi:hypothetical protein
MWRSLTTTIDRHSGRIVGGSVRRAGALAGEISSPVSSFGDPTR